MSVDRREAVAAVEEFFEYQFIDPDNCWEALNCKGAGGFPQGHTRLALLGDSLLRWRLIEAWYPTGETTGKPRLILLNLVSYSWLVIEIGTNILNRLSSNPHLTLIGRNIGLQAYINPNPSQKGEVSDKMIAGTVEALLAAFYREGGVETLDMAMARLELLPESSR